MRIFLTGGGGFVGQHLINRFIADGNTVLALARSDASTARVRDLGAEAVRGDLEDLATGRAPWTRELAACDAIVHAAAYMEFWGPDRLFEERNLHPTVALFRAAADRGVPRFVFISAASVSSGTQRAAIVDEQTATGRPNIAYSRVKLATENALLGARSEQTKLIILRPPFIWGAGMTTINEIADGVRAGQFAWIDHGRHTFDYVHAENLAHATAQALTRGTPDGIYYVTDDQPRPVREFFGALIETQGLTPPARSVPRPLATMIAAVMEAVYKLLRRPTPPPLTHWLVSVMGRDRSYDISAARRDLHYTPVVSLAAGTAEMAGVSQRDRTSASRGSNPG
jgi:nucleoside-diphosphate-sugar epimerase